MGYYTENVDSKKESELTGILGLTGWRRFLHRFGPCTINGKDLSLEDIAENIRTTLGLSANAARTEAEEIIVAYLDKEFGEGCLGILFSYDSYELREWKDSQTNEVRYKLRSCDSEGPFLW